MENKLWSNYANVAENEMVLWDRIKEVWPTISQETILNHVDSMPERLLTVAKAIGACTKF